MPHPLKTLGLRHLALKVKNLEACVKFYVELLGMHIEWQPDADNVYLTTGHDNLALHRAPENYQRSQNQALDHLGFIIATAGEVDHWHEYLSKQGVNIEQGLKTHRDGARSFYCEDPDGNIVQLIYHPPLSSIKSDSNSIKFKEIKNETGRQPGYLRGKIVIKNSFNKLSKSVLNYFRSKNESNSSK
jgi:catechol 2,3-dioxygenase-like lactoylglutathione lyase family enzyme